MQITLIIPGLAGPAARYSTDFLPAVPALDCLLARAEHRRPTPDTSPQAILSHVFGCAPEPGHDVPVAAVTHTIDAAGVGRGIWMRADPVHLRPDRRGAVLLEAAAVGLDTRDALALAAEVKPVLEAAGHNLEVPCAERWYLRLHSLPDLHTVELDRVAGRDITAAMPRGADAQRWLRLLNEIQMVLHQGPLNADRATRGLAPINSLWFWGCGPTPTPVPGRWQRIHGTDLFLRGLAELGGNVCLPVPADLEECMADADEATNPLVMIETCAGPAAYQAVEAWSAAVLELERRWFAPLLAALRSRRLTRVTLITDVFGISVSPRDLLCFWRRRGSLAQLAPGVTPA